MTRDLGALTSPRMTWFRDLTSCRYGGRKYQEALAVGWLGEDMPFPSGSVDESILEGLGTIAALAFDAWGL